FVFSRAAEYDSRRSAAIEKPGGEPEQLFAAGAASEAYFRPADGGYAAGGPARLPAERGQDHNSRGAAAIAHLGYSRRGSIVAGAGESGDECGTGDQGARRGR